MASIVSQTPMHAEGNWQQQQPGSYGSGYGNDGYGSAGGYGGPQQGYGGPQPGYGGQQQQQGYGNSGYGAPGSAGAAYGGGVGVGGYGSPQGPGNKQQQQQGRAAALELEDNASVDTEIAKQIKKGLIDASDVAPPTADELENAPRQVFRRKVKKMVEVPVTRKVKVPTTTQKIVEDVEIKRMRTKKQVQEPAVRWVEEAYTEIEELPATRMKEVWVKKLVPETYMKKVEVRKTRKVKVPILVTKEVEVEEEIKVPTTKVVDVPTFRIDEIKDTKLVEVEGYQEVELVPRIRDTNIRIERSRDLQKRCRKLERRIGVEEYADDEPALDDVDTDSDPDDEGDGENPILKSHGDVKLDGTEKRTKPKGSKRRAHRFITAESQPEPELESATAEDRTVTPRSKQQTNKDSATTVAEKYNFTPAPPASSSTPKRVVPTPPGSSSGSVGNVFMMFGFRLVEKAGKGLLVTQVTPGGYAAKYGIGVGDVVKCVDGKNVATIREWRGVLSLKQCDADLLVLLERQSGEMDAVLINLTDFNPKQYMDDPMVR